MSEWDRYRPDVVDMVFRMLGATSVRPPDDTRAYAWSTTTKGVLRVTSFVPGPELPGIRADHVELLARQLGLDPVRAFALLRERGGKIL